MPQSNIQHPKSKIARRGIALIEAIIAMLILASLLTAAMQVAGVSAVMQQQNAQRSTARFLARALAADLAPLAYKEPIDSPLFGCEAGETAGSKVNYDDVDDFNGWNESPPQQRDGTAMTGMGDYTRRVTVQWVNAANLSQVSVSETGVKHITIQVIRGKKILASQVLVRTAAP